MNISKIFVISLFLYFICVFNIEAVAGSYPEGPIYDMVEIAKEICSKNEMSISLEYIYPYDHSEAFTCELPGEVISGNILINIIEIDAIILCRMIGLNWGGVNLVLKEFNVENEIFICEDEDIRNENIRTNA